jgi:ribosomal protein S18 acetylase RimI-like enzyme
MEPVVAADPDVVGLAGVFARAFVGDPMVAWRRPHSTVEESVDHYQGVLDEYVALGVLWRIPGVGAAAAWLSPADSSRLRDSRTARRRTSTADDDMSSAPEHPVRAWLDSHLPVDPVLFLDLLAVAPEAQGAGWGGLLVGHGLGRARGMGLTAFLETSNERNLAFYESYGFQVVDHGCAPGGGPTVWFLQTRAPNRQRPQPLHPRNAT